MTVEEEIEKYLEEIQKNRYGHEIRLPIYHALFKINQLDGGVMEIKRGAVVPGPIQPIPADIENEVL